MGICRKNNFNILAYDISRKLIDTIEPSSELSEFGLQIARAHIYNNNFKLADKWITYTESFKSENEEFVDKIKSVRLLYNLKNSIDDNQFTNILIDNLYNMDSDIFNSNYKDSTKQEIIFTLLSIISDNQNINLIGNKILFEQRSMPSRYLLNKIRNSAKIKSFGELILSINISMIDKKWSEIHPEHLKIILNSLKITYNEKILNEIVIEILEESKII